MPMYDYACKECGHTFEIRLRMSQAGEPQECPSCGDGNTRKLISGAFAVGGTSSRSTSTAPSAPAGSPFS